MLLVSACKCGNFKGIYKLHANCETCKFCLSHIVSNVIVLFVVSYSQSS